MSTRKPSLVALGVLAVASLCAATSFTASAATSKPAINIAAVLSLTGTGSSLGQEEKEGITVAQKAINEKGGINGRQVNVRFVDDQSTPDQAVQQTRAIIQSFQPQAIIGGSISATCLAMKPVTEQAKVLQYCLSAAPITYPAPYYFAAQSPFTRWIADVPIYWMQKQGITSVGCLASSDSSGQLTAQVVGYAAKAAGLKFTSVSFDPTSTDVTPQLTQLRNDNPGALYVCTTGSGVVTALQGIRQLGLTMPIWISSGSASAPIAQLIKGILPSQGAFTAGAKIQVADALPKTDPQRKKILAFQTPYIKRTGHPADIFAATGTDAFTILVKAISSLPVGADAATIAKYMEDKTAYTGVQLTYDFHPNDHRGTDLDGLVEKFTSAGGFSLVALYPPKSIPRYGGK